MRLSTKGDSLKSTDAGKVGEDIACAYLVANGYKIHNRNWHFSHKEIDIVAQKEEEIVVVEVKSRDENFAEEPWEAVTTAKIRNIVEVADAWLKFKEVDLETRFDIISIIFFKNGSHTLEHFEGAFLPPVN